MSIYLFGTGYHFVQEFNKVINDKAIHDADNVEATINSYDAYLTMEVGIRHGPDDEIQQARVKHCAVDSEGNPVGTENKNPLLNTRAYELEYMDRTSEILTANIIAEHILSQVDEEGHRQLML